MRLKNFVLAICSAVSLLACSVSGSPLGQASQPSLTGPTTIPPTSGFGDPSTVVTLDAQGNMNWVGGAWYVPLPVSAGDVIGTVTAIVRDNGAANGHTLDGNNVLAKLVSRTPTGDTTRAFWSSDGSGNRQTATLTPSSGYRVQVGDEVLVEFFGLTGGAIPGPSTVPSMTGPVRADPITPTHTRIVPTMPPAALSAGTPSPAATFCTNGSMLSLPISPNDGETIAAIRLRFRDNSVGPTPVVVGIASTEDDAVAFNFLATSPHSPGNGVDQTISLSTSVAVRQHVQYYIVAAPSSGTAPCLGYRAEYDYF